MLGIVVNGRYLGGLMSQKNEPIIFGQFAELRQKWTKNAQISQKLSQISVFPLLFNDEPKKLTALLAIDSLSTGGMKINFRTGVTIYKWPPHNITTAEITDSGKCRLAKRLLPQKR